MKHLFFLMIVFSVLTGTSMAQTSSDTASVAFTPEKKPEFKGGINGWLRFLENNLNRNLLTNTNAAAGQYRVLGEFLVDIDGSVRDITIEQDPGYGTADEYKRVLKLSGKKWNPAMDKGKPVPFRTKQSLTFVLN